MSEFEFERGDILPYEETGFDAKVRKVFMRMLRDPLSFPGEYKAWLPPFIEQANIQVPVSQLVGNYVSADSVAGLGAPIHGRRGMVRAGTSDFDFVELVYDGEFGRWVSAPVTVLTQLAKAIPNSTQSTTYVDAEDCSGSVQPWEVWDTAGLTMQFRYLTAVVTTDASRTASTTLQFSPYTVNAGAGTPVDSTDHTLTTESTSGVLKDSGWQDIPVSITVDDYLLIEARMKIEHASQFCAISGATAWMRWVSKTA